MFGVYPCSLIPDKQKIIIYNKNTKSYYINKNILDKSISDIDNGNYIKFCTFKRTPTKFHGHSMIIRKNENNDFSFFDPNDGVRLNLTLNELVAVLNEKILDHKKMWSHNDITFIKNTKLLNIINNNLSINLKKINIIDNVNSKVFRKNFCRG